MLKKRNLNKYITVIFLSIISHGAFCQTFYKGVDLSYVNELEDCGIQYFDKDGNEKEVYGIFEANGANIVRLRLWHNPAWTNYSNLADVKKSIKRAKDVGVEVLLDFHYSDFWTDPGRNWRPEAWEQIDDDNLLGDSLYLYTFNTLQELHTEGLVPEMVQIGNETNGNILIKRGNADIGGNTPDLYPINWDRQAMLFNRALKAVEDFETMNSEDVVTVIHVASPGSAASWFAEAEENGLTQFDIIGLSYYPQYHELGVREVGEQIGLLKERFEKEIMLVEVGYPWTASSAGDNANNVLGAGGQLPTYDSYSAQVQKEFLTELTWLVKDNGGAGVIYWEPAWVASTCQTYWGTGSHWDNATLFDFDHKPHAGIDFLSYDYSVKPEALEDQKVTFIVDMTAIDTENGVYVTGDFTGSSWTLIPMTLAKNNLYELESTIPGRTAGAYVFYNDDDWSAENRESVPELCASVWNTHREYRIKGEATSVHFSWGRCDQTPNEAILFNSNDVKSTSFLFPTIAEHSIQIKNIQTTHQVALYDSSGKIFRLNSVGNDEFSVTHLPGGLYFIRLTNDQESIALKFLKK